MLPRRLGALACRCRRRCHPGALPHEAAGRLTAASSTTWHSGVWERRRGRGLSAIGLAPTVHVGRNQLVERSHHESAARGPDASIRSHGPSSAARKVSEQEHREILDEALAAARDGDEQGFVVLWRALHPPLLRYLGARAGDSPEDVASETWFQVIRDLPSFKGDAGDFRAWLFTVARNRAIDAGRARSARPAVPLHEATPDDRPVPSAETMALENVSTTAALELVATLPADQAEMVLLRVVAGLDVATVARMVGRRPGTVRVAIHRALQRLSRDVRVRAAREVV